MLETLLEKYTIEVVVNRTKISRKNLEKLRDREFDGLTRPQAIGFVRILEREFDEDFSDLKEAIDAYLKEAPSLGNEPIFIREGREGTGGSRRWPLALLLGALAILGLYLFQKEFSAPPPAASAVSQPSSSPQTAASAASGPQSDAAPAEEKPQPEVSDISAEAASAGEEPQASQSAAETNETVAVAEEPFVPMEPVALTPSLKLWLGIIDLKSKKRRATVTARPYEIDSHGKKLLLTGHGRFEISDAFGNLFKYNDAKKHYFLIEEGVVREIDAAEFRRLNGGKGW